MYLQRKKPMKNLHSSLTESYIKARKKWSDQNKSVIIGDQVYFPLESKVYGTPLIIKDGTNVNGMFTVKGSSPVVIGRYCDIAEGFFVISSNHNANYLNLQADLQGCLGSSLDVTKGPINVGHGVWIGDRVTILPGVQVGDGAIIGAGSVVTRNVPAMTVVAGVPARVIRSRFPDSTMRKIRELGWWYWDLNSIINNKDLFKDSVRTIHWKEFPLNNSIVHDMNKIDFTEDEIGNFLTGDWGLLEAKSRWMLGKRAMVVFVVGESKKYKRLKFSCYSYYRSTKVVVRVNGKMVQVLKISNVLDKYEVKLNNLINGTNYVEFDVKGLGCVPSEVEGSPDKRRLFLRFMTTELSR